MCRIDRPHGYIWFPILAVQENKGVLKMSVVINTNSDALRIQNTLTGATNKLSQTMQRMSSGLKINSAKDDAAGTVISARMNVQINGNKICQQNVQNANALLSTAEGNLDVVLDNVSRIRDLTLQAKNGTYSQEEIKAMQDEVYQRIQEIDRVSDVSKFSQLQLFGGEELAEGAFFQVGTNSGDENVIKVTNEDNIFSSVKFNDLLKGDGVSEEALFKNSTATKFDFKKTYDNASQIEDEVVGTVYKVGDGYMKCTAADTFKSVTEEGYDIVDSVGTKTNYDGWAQGTVVYSKTQGYVTITKVGASDGTYALCDKYGVVDIDTASPAGAVNGVKYHSTLNGKYFIGTAGDPAEIVDQFNTASYADDAAAKDAGITGQANDGKIYYDSTNKVYKQYNYEKDKFVELKSKDLYSDANPFDLTTMDQAGFVQALDALDAAIDDITARKSAIGSFEGRLESALNTLTTQQTNLSSAKSIITDSDIASEAANYTQNQILQQVATSLLAQANQAPSVALSLI